MDGTGGATPLGRFGIYSQAGSDWHRSLLASLLIRCRMPLINRLDRRGSLFLDSASASFEDGERCGSGELSEDNSSSAGRSISSGMEAPFPLSGRDGGRGRGGPRDLLARLASKRVCRRSFSSCKRFACSCNSTICRACSSCLASISWRQWRNWSTGG